MSYIIITSSTSDDYKRPVNTTHRIMAETLEDAKALAVIEYVNRLEGYEGRIAKSKEAPQFFKVLNSAFGFFPGVEEDEDEELAEQEFEEQREVALQELPELVNAMFDFFQDNERSLFQGEYVPSFFSLKVEKNEPFYEKPDVNDTLKDFFYRFEQVYEPAT
jgi:hypothetical protein